MKYAMQASNKCLKDMSLANPTISMCMFFEHSGSQGNADELRLSSWH